MRTVIALLEIDDDRAFDEGIGTLDYLEREFSLLKPSGVFIDNARILDDDDEYDAKAIGLANKIFEEE
jgi:hypothetical protein